MAENRRRVDARRIIGGIGRVFIASGVLILLFVAYQLWGTGIAEARSQNRLRSDFLDALQNPSTTTTASTSTTTPGETTETTEATGPPPAPTGEAVAIIRIPKIGVEKAVVQGVGVPDLKKGPGHYPTTPMPGQPGNAAIAGHRTTYGAPFYRLDELKEGDHIEVTTQQGVFTYEVMESKVVKPTQSEVLDPTPDNRLTLTTCNPRFSASQRLVVVSKLVDNPAPPPPAVTEPPAPTATSVPSGAPSTTVPKRLPGEAGLSGQSSPKLPAILWGLLAALVWFVTWLLSKRWGRIPAYAMGTPVFLVVLFIFFENFARLLPANV